MYSPKISEDIVRQLYQLKTILKIPITRIVNTALRDYLNQHSLIIKQQKKEEVS